MEAAGRLCPLDAVRTLNSRAAVSSARGRVTSPPEFLIVAVLAIKNQKSTSPKKYTQNPEFLMVAVLAIKNPEKYFAKKYSQNPRISHSGSLRPRKYFLPKNTHTKRPFNFFKKIF